MANAKQGGIIAAKTATTKAAVAQTTLGAMIGSVSVQERFEKMLGKKANSFLSSLLTLANNQDSLKKADPLTVLSAASIAASLDLPINPSLGFAWVVAYKSTAQFQIGYKGLIQLAQRSGLMKSIVMTEVYEGEITDFNRFTECFETGERVSDLVVGFYASFELVNGFRKASYWSVDDVKNFAKAYSKTYKFSGGVWEKEFNKMACKTVLTQLLKTYAPLSTEMQMALEADDKTAVEHDNGMTEYIDVETEETSEKETLQDGRKVDPKTGEIKEGFDDAEMAAIVAEE